MGSNCAFAGELPPHTGRACLNQAGGFWEEVGFKRGSGFGDSGFDAAIDFVCFEGVCPEGFFAGALLGRAGLDPGFDEDGEVPAFEGWAFGAFPFRGEPWAETADEDLPEFCGGVRPVPACWGCIGSDFGCEAATIALTIS